MKSRTLSARVTLVAILGLMLMTGVGRAEENPDIPGWIEEAARSYAAQQAGVGEEELTLHSSTEVTFPVTGVMVYNFKYAYEPADETYDIAVDDTGALADLPLLIQNENDASDALYGPVAPELHDLLAAAMPGELFEVGITVEVSGEPTVTRPDPELEIGETQLEDLLLQLDSEEDLLVQQALDPVVSQLQGMGYEVEADTAAPVLKVDLPAEVILNTVANWSEVVAIDPAEIFEELLEIQVPTMHTNVIHNRGFTGTGERAAVIEVGGRINTANPNLAPPRIVQDTLYSCVSAHTAGVAGIVGGSGATNINRQGHAPNTNMWIGGSCGGWGSQLRNRSTAAANWGARTFNLSWGNSAGGMGTTCRYYDGLVRNRWRTVVVAAGNSGPNGRVGSPATAYNVVAVGSFDDRNTYPWGDDVMSAFSSGVPPASRSNDRIKPEVAAPGSNLNSTTNSSPWTGAIGSGTSFAAPGVTGLTALMMDRNISLRVWPESVKAILMTTAQHNIVGSARLSRLDGAGGVVSDRADDVVRRNSGNWSGISYNCSRPQWLTLTTFTAQSGQRVRAAIVWDTDPNYGRYTSRPSADLDLWVRGPNGTVVAISASWDNTYEIVDFTAPQTGTYTMRVRKWRCSSNPRWLGWAYHR